MGDARGQAQEPRARLDVTRGAAAGVCGFLLTGALEACVLAGVTDLFAHGLGSALIAFMHLLGIVGMLGFLTGIVLAWLLPSLDRSLFVLLLPSRAAALDELRLCEASAAGSALAVSALLPVTCAWLSAVSARGFNRAALAGPYAALLMGASLVLQFLVYFPLRDTFLSLVLRFAPTGRKGRLPLPLVLLLLSLVASLCCALLLVGGADLSSIRFGPGLFFLLGVALSVLLWYVAPKLASPRLSASLLLFVLLSAGFAVVGLGENPTSATVLPVHGFLSQLGVRAFRALLDFDRDGYAALMGGGDCDDTDPRIHPGALDVPGNGVDENCVGGDAGLEDPADAYRGKAKPSVTPRPLSIVLLLIDTLRPDHMGAYGYQRATTPNIDGWAKSATVFERVYAQAPHTPRSLPSILTGRYPSRLSWVDRHGAFSDIGPDNETLFELAARAGMKTEAVTAHYYFDQVPTLKRGVGRWDNQGTTENVRESLSVSVDPDVTRRALERLDVLARSPTPFVFFAHYFAPHGHYMAHPELPSFGTAEADYYDGEIAFVDHHIAPVLARLDRDDLRERTVVVLFSDHGESLDDHGLKVHGRAVYDAETRVPLLMRVPGFQALRIKELTALIDLLPTLGEITGFTPNKAQGLSLAPLLTGQHDWPDRTVFSEVIPYPAYPYRIVSAVDGAGHKLIRDVTRNATMLFDLTRDPKELRPIEPSSARDGQLFRELAAFLDADARSMQAQESASEDKTR
jgi:arylsulfatase A-like enzyme